MKRSYSAINATGPDPATQTMTFRDRQGNTYTQWSDGSESISCWDGSRTTPCRDRYAKDNWVPDGYRCVVTGQCGPVLSDVDFVSLSANIGPFSGTVTVDKHGRVYLSVGGGYSITSASVTAAVGKIAGTDTDVESFLTGLGTTACGTFSGGMICGAKSSDGRVALLIGFESAGKDASVNYSWTVKIYDPTR